MTSAQKYLVRYRTVLSKPIENNALCTRTLSPVLFRYCTGNFTANQRNESFEIFRFCYEKIAKMKMVRYGTNCTVLKYYGKIGCTYIIRYRYRTHVLL